MFLNSFIPYPSGDDNDGFDGVGFIPFESNSTVSCAYSRHNPGLSVMFEEGSCVFFLSFRHWSISTISSFSSGQFSLKTSLLPLYHFGCLSGLMACLFRSRNSLLHTTVQARMDMQHYRCAILSAYQSFFYYLRFIPL